MPILIIILLGLSLLLVSISFAYYRIVREPKAIGLSFVLSSLIAIAGLIGRLGLLYKVEMFLYTFMFGPILFFTIYQLLRYFYKKSIGKEPVTSYATDFDIYDGRRVTSGDYMFTFLLLILTFVGLFGLNYFLGMI